MATAIKSKEEIVLEDNELVCILTGEVKKVKNEETNLQSVILMLNEEYGFDLDDMERNFTIDYEDQDTGTSKRQKVDLVIFEKDKPHEQDFIASSLAYLWIVVQSPRYSGGGEAQLLRNLVNSGFFFMEFDCIIIPQWSCRNLI